MSLRANIAAIALATLLGCGETAVDSPVPQTPAGFVDGKADGFGDALPFTGRCAADAPAVPYQPVPDGTRSQPNGPNVLHTRVGVEIDVSSTAPTHLRGEFTGGDCGRHYFAFTLDRRANVRVVGTSLNDDGPAPLALCFVSPQFIRIDTSWYTDIWQRTAPDVAPPCETFVPVGDELQPSSGADMTFGPGVYELTIDPAMSAAGTYDLALAFEALDDAVCGNGALEAGESCDDGGQEPLDWCGANCRPQRLDIEPIAGNETFETAQPLDGFHVMNFYSPRGVADVDFYRFDLLAGETLHLVPGERACDDTSAQVFDGDGNVVGAPWKCSGSEGKIAATSDTTLYLRLETQEDGARSIHASIKP